jgi:hypothetical protein
MAYAWDRPAIELCKAGAHLTKILGLHQIAGIAREMISPHRVCQGFEHRSAAIDSNGLGTSD